MKKKKSKKNSSLGMGLDSLLKATQVELEKVSHVKPPEEKQEKAELPAQKQSDKTDIENLPDAHHEESEVSASLIEEPTALDVLQDKSSESSSESEVSKPEESETAVEQSMPEESEEKQQAETPSAGEIPPEITENKEITAAEESGEFRKELERLASFDKTQFEFLKFDVGGELIGLNVQIIQEIIKKPFLTVIPESPYFVEGIFSLRSRVIPLVNMGRYLGIYDHQLNENTMAIILHVGDMRIGLGVDRVYAIGVIQADDIKNPPSALASRNSEIIKGIARIDEKAVTFLDPIALTQKMHFAIKKINT